MLGNTEPEGEGETISNCEDTWQKQMGTCSAKVQRSLLGQLRILLCLLLKTTQEDDPTHKQFFIPQCQLPTALTSCDSLEQLTDPNRSEGVPQVCPPVLGDKQCPQGALGPTSSTEPLLWQGLHCPMC